MASALQQRLEMASAQQQSAPAAQRSTPDLDTSLDDDASSASIAWHRERASEVWAAASSYDPLQRSPFAQNPFSRGGLSCCVAGVTKFKLSLNLDGVSGGQERTTSPRRAW